MQSCASLLLNLLFTFHVLEACEFVSRASQHYCKVGKYLSHQWRTSTEANTFWSSHRNSGQSREKKKKKNQTQPTQTKNQERTFLLRQLLKLRVFIHLVIWKFKKKQGGKKNPLCFKKQLFNQSLGNLRRKLNMEYIIKMENSCSNRY